MFSYVDFFCLFVLFAGHINKTRLYKIYLDRLELDLLMCSGWKPSFDIQKMLDLLKVLDRSIFFLIHFHEKNITQVLEMTCYEKFIFTPEQAVSPVLKISAAHAIYNNYAMAN